MAFAITPVAAKDGNQNTIVGGLDFIDTSGTGAGPWIITKVTIDAAGVNVQAVLSNGAAKVDLASAAGTALAATANGLKVDGSSVTQPVSGTFWQTTQPVSAASLPLPAGAATSALQTTINTTLGSPMQNSGGSVTANAGTNLNTSLLALESGGNLATLAGGVTSSIYQENVAKINNVTPLMNNGVSGTGSQRINLASDNTAIANWGQGATGSAVPSGAIYQAGIASTSLATAATAGNLTGRMIDKFGRAVNLISTIRDLVGTQTTTISASTSETTIVTAASGVFNDLIMLIVTNTSASTATRIDFRDTTGGTVLFSLISIGGQQPVGFSLATPIPQTTANKNWTAQCATSTTDVRIYAVFAQNQ